jgi:cation transport protein ChaC
MPKRHSEALSLTRDLAALACRPVEDSGPTPGLAYLIDGELQVEVKNFLSAAPTGFSARWLFAYGSLLWTPECEVGETRNAVVHGWHRSFCLRVFRFRGTIERPGLMMSLDKGGQCHGIVFRLTGNIEKSLEKLFRREVVTKPPVQYPRWLTAKTTEGAVRALGFVVNRQSPRYAGKLSLGEVASVIATAAGHWGSCAEYLCETVTKLEQFGIHDRNLWSLQKLVADAIRASAESV